MGQFEFLEWTADSHLRHSRFVGLWENKNARASCESKDRLALAEGTPRRTSGGIWAGWRGWAFNDPAERWCEVGDFNAESLLDGAVVGARTHTAHQPASAPLNGGKSAASATQTVP